MSNIFAAFGFTLLSILVIAVYVRAFRRQRAATRRRWREGDDAVASMHSGASLSVFSHGAPTNGVDPSYSGGGGEFGGGGASESYDSGGDDSGDGGGDGGGDSGD
jgi:hypothetical protein